MVQGEEDALADPDAKAEFERFFATVKGSLMGQAYLLTGDMEEARDLVQEALLRAWKNWSRVRGFDDPQAWARRVLHNLAIGSWRRERSRSRAGVEAPASTPAPSVTYLDLVDALGRLPAKQRRALVLHDVVGLPVAEVAIELRTREGTVRSWLSRSRAFLAAELAPEPVERTEGTKR